MVVENQAKTLSCYTKRFPNMVAENKIMRSTLKFKVTTKGIWNVSEDKSLEGTDGQRRRISVGGSKHSEAKVLANPSVAVNQGKQRTDMSIYDQRWKIQRIDLSEDMPREGSDVQRDRVSVGGSMHHEANVSVEKSMPADSAKRKPETSLDDQRCKRQKMDRYLKIECSKILKGLMNHSVGWVFNEPVDPVKLKIPDYLEIIKKPMDLGTIKHKLERNMYFDAKEFADDVKLTFENAKSYNPPSHQVHHWAEMLDAIFSRRWKLLEATKLKHTNKDDEGPNNVNYKGNNGLKSHHVMKPDGFNKVHIHDELGTSRTISLEERLKCRPGHMKAEPGKVALNGCSSMDKIAEKGRCNKSASRSGKLRESIDLTEAKYSPPSPSGTNKNVAAQRSASDISSERSLEHNNYGDSKLDCEVKCTPASLANKLSLDSDGPGVVLDEENSPCSTPATEEGWSVDTQMSPKKALRAAMLKSRFADTIFRATHPGEKKSDLSRMQQERQRLEREKLKEKARIEAQIKAAEAASRRKEQNDLKMRLARQREAARMELERMERTVEIDKNASILRDLEVLFGCPGRTGYPDCNALAEVGLHRKDEYFEEDEDAVLNVEEGEIMG